MKTSARLLGALGLAAAFIGFAGMEQAQAEDITWDMANEYSAATIVGLADKHFADLVAEKTGGKLNIVNQFGGAAGLKSADLIDAIGSGAVPLGNFPLEVGSGHNQMYLVTNLPLIGQTLEEAAVMQEIARPYLEETLAKDNLQLLYMIIWPPVGIWASEELADAESLKGVPIRVNHPIATAIFKNAGAAPVQLSWGDVVPQLQVGAIEAVHTSISGGTLGLPLDKVPYYIDVGTHVGQSAAVVNRDVLDDLPADLKQAVLEAAAETEAWVRETISGQMQSETDALVDKGAKIVSGADVSVELVTHLREVSAPIIDEWLSKTGAEGEAFLEAYRARTQ